MRQSGCFSFQPETRNLTGFGCVSLILRSSTRKLKPGGNNYVASPVGSTYYLQIFFSFGPTRLRVISPVSCVERKTECEMATTLAKGRKVHIDSDYKNVISS